MRSPPEGSTEIGMCQVFVVVGFTHEASQGSVEPVGQNTPRFIGAGRIRQEVVGTHQRHERLGLPGQAEYSLPLLHTHNLVGKRLEDQQGPEWTVPWPLPHSLSPSMSTSSTTLPARLSPSKRSEPLPVTGSSP